MRRRLLKQARLLAERNVDPPPAEDGSVYRVRFAETTISTTEELDDCSPPAPLRARRPSAGRSRRKAGTWPD